MIASGNHLLTQVKDNQPSLRRKLELGAAGRKPTGSHKSETVGRNRWETRKLTVFPVKAWFRGSPSGRTSSKPCSAWSERSARRRSEDRDFASKQTRPSSGFPRLPSPRAQWAGTNGFARIGALRMAVTTCATPPLPRTLPHSEEPRYRRAPALLRLQSDQGFGM